jgi:plasmid stabilization system protein ParE
MKFAVHISQRAQRDIRDVSQWIAKKSKIGALRWLDALETVVDRLAQDASSYPLADESRLLPFPVREITFRNSQGATLSRHFCNRRQSRRRAQRPSTWPTRCNAGGL